MIVDPRQGFAIDDGALHWRRAAIPGQKGGVDVDHAQPGNAQQTFRDQLAVGGDHAQVGRQAGEPLSNGRLSKAIWLEDGDLVRECDRLDGTVRDFLSAPAPAIGLRDDADDVMPGPNELFERRDGELRRAEEDNPNGAYHLPARDSFRILRTMMSF